MRKLLLTTCFGAAALFTAGYAFANEELTKLAADGKQWVMPTQDFANTRYSQLKQINAENVHKIAPAWTFSTGVCADTKGRRSSSATPCFARAVPEHRFRA